MKSCTIRHSIQLLFLACPALLNAQQALPDVSVKANTTSATPVGAVDYPAEITDVRPIAKDQPAYALPQVLEGQPGLIAEGVFGGIDHPRLSIRGSGLQRGTQPAGRGIEIREQGLPLGFADTSFDFVESIDPLAYDEVRVLRSGRATVTGATTLGGVIDFVRHPNTHPIDEHSVRYEVGSHGFQNMQATATQNIGEARAEVRIGDYRKNGFRQHNRQEAQRSVLSLEGALAESAWRWRAGVSDLHSELQLPGPQTQAQIVSGANVAQAGNVRGNWRRTTQRTRVNTGLEGPTAQGTLSVNLAYQLADVQFMRRDEQDESNEDIAFSARYTPNNSPWFFETVYQHNQRELDQYLNGSGVPAGFTGFRGLKWADNSLRADRLALTTGIEQAISEQSSLLMAVGVNHHTRSIRDNFQTSAARPEASLNSDYTQLSGMAEMRYALNPNSTVFVGFSTVGEPPTYDSLLLNNAGTGMNTALINGADPRRPTIKPLDEQRQNTLEAGWRHAGEQSSVDITVYYAELKREIIATVDPVNLVNTNLRNADNTRRVGAELNATQTLLDNPLNSGTRLQGLFNLNWVDARFDEDPVFKNNTLPVVTPLTLYSAIALIKPRQWSTELFAQSVTRGAYVDYANTTRAGDYLTLGLRGQINLGDWELHAEARNLTDERYASTVIGASLNTLGADSVSFAPGEPQSFTVGATLRF